MAFVEDGVAKATPKRREVKRTPTPRATPKKVEANVEVKEHRVDMDEPRNRAKKDTLKKFKTHVEEQFDLLIKRIELLEKQNIRPEINPQTLLPSSEELIKFLKDTNWQNKSLAGMRRQIIKYGKTSDVVNCIELLRAYFREKYGSD